MISLLIQVCNAFLFDSIRNSYVKREGVGNTIDLAKKEIIAHRRNGPYKVSP